MQVCALHSPPVRCMVAQASCAVGGVITVTKRSSSASYTHYKKNTKLSVSTCTLGTPDYMLRQFLLSVRASVLIHKPSRAVRARCTFEGIVVTTNCTPCTTVQQWSSWWEHRVPFANRRVRDSAFSWWLVTLLLLVLAIKLKVRYSSAGTQYQL